MPLVSVLSRTSPPARVFFARVHLRRLRLHPYEYRHFQTQEIEMEGLGAGLAAPAFWGFIAAVVGGGIWYAVLEK